MDKLDFAIEVLLIGFFVVMFTLFVLYGILIFFNRIFHKKSVMPAVAGEHTGGKAVTGTTSKDFEGRTAAAIVAAVYQYMQEYGTSGTTGPINMVIQSPVNYNRGNNWQMVGRKNILENRSGLENIRRKKQRENI